MIRDNLVEDYKSLLAIQAINFIITFHYCLFMRTSKEKRIQIPYSSRQVGVRKKSKEKPHLKAAI